MSKELDYDKELKEQAATISRLTRESHKKDLKIRGYKGLEKRNQNEQNEHNHDHPENTEDQPEKTEKIVKEPHFIGNWQQHCPTCGDKNKDFKDETICDIAEGGCGMHLGAKENLKKLKACPSCGGTKARLIEKKADK